MKQWLWYVAASNVECPENLYCWNGNTMIEDPRQAKLFKTSQEALEAFAIWNDRGEWEDPTTQGIRK